jgi:molybdopterin-guanine dinucleotide biosynthesis protein A
MVRAVYDQLVNDRSEFGVTAFILAGGKSSRMGSDKAFVRIGDETLLSRALKAAQSLGGEIRIVGDARKFAAFGRVVEDVYPERGPLGGIHAALVSSGTELNLMVAVDLPFIAPEFLKYLLARARESNAMIMVPQAGGRLQPLCATYRRGFAEIAEEALARGENKIDALFDRVETRVIEEAELVQARFSADMFRNLNTPGDLEQARISSSGLEN